MTASLELPFWSENISQMSYLGRASTYWFASPATSACLSPNSLPFPATPKWYHLLLPLIWLFIFPEKLPFH
jgi:hypothetical protein